VGDGNEPPGRGPRDRRPSGPPLVYDESAATYECASDEYGRLGRPQPPRPRRQVAPDSRLLRPDNLYDWYVCVRGNRVEQLWHIVARGVVYMSGIRRALDQSRPSLSQESSAIRSGRACTSRPTNARTSCWSISNWLRWALARRRSVRPRRQCKAASVTCSSPTRLLAGTNCGG